MSYKTMELKQYYHTGICKEKNEIQNNNVNNSTKCLYQYIPICLLVFFSLSQGTPGYSVSSCRSPQ